MNAIKSCATLLLVLSLGACGNSNTGSGSSEGRKLGRFVSESQVDVKKQFFLAMAETTQTDSSVIYVAQALHGADTVGLKFEVKKNIPAGITAEGRPDQVSGFTSGTIRITSLGQQSDNLLRVLAESFELSAPSQMTAETLTPQVFSSNRAPVDLDKSQTYSFKLFFERSSGPAAEIFLNIDNYKKAFELTENNTELRGRLLEVFAGE